MMRAGAIAELEIDLSAEQFGRAVPYESFKQLREKAPVFWYEPEQYWVVSSHEMIGRINRDPQRFSSAGGPAPARIGNDPFKNSLTLLTMDPPMHTQYRRRVSRRFAPRPIEAQEDSVRLIARELIKDFVDRGGGDFVTDVAAPFPLRVMGTMLGIQREDEATVNKRMNAIVQGSDPEYGVATEEGKVALAQEANDYYDHLIDDHRRRPRGDLVDMLLDSRVDGVALTNDELRAWIGMFTAGGAETTRHLISQGLMTILEWPDERRKFVSGSDASLAVEEMLRWSSPVMHHARWPVVPVDVVDKRIEVGQRTTLWMISANRDEQAFHEPDKFDINRAPNHHDSLGAGGPHFCLGAGLARLEARILFEELRPHLERMSMCGPAIRARNTMFNSLKHLPIVVESV